MRKYAADDFELIRIRLKAIQDDERKFPPAPDPTAESGATGVTGATGHQGEAPGPTYTGDYC